MRFENVQGSIVAMIILLIITQTGCGDKEPVSKTEFALDTVCTVTVYDIDGNTVEGGFSMIDTSSTSNKYVLKLSFSLGSNSFELTVHVNVVVA